jgi:hypothetical protein
VVLEEDTKVVQIIPRSPSTSEKFGRAFSGFGQGIAEGIPEFLREKSQREALQKRFGKGIENIRDPNILSSLVASELRGEEQQRKRKDITDYLNDYFETPQGKKFTPFQRKIIEGEATGVIPRGTGNSILKMMGEEGLSKQEDMNEEEFPEFMEMMQGAEGTEEIPPQFEPAEMEEEFIPSPPKKTAKEKEEWPEITMSYPKDIKIGDKRQYEKMYRDENSDIYGESKTKTKFAKEEKNSLNILDSLSDDIPGGMSRFFIKPDGSIRPLAQTLGLVPRQAQRFVKTVNDFTTKAKDSYGSRVTNFDLQQFMSRLPTLMNSKDGRKAIIKQMQITNRLNNLYYKTLKQAYENYGLDVPQEKIEKVVQEKIKSKEKELKNQYNGIESEIDAIFSGRTSSGEKRSLEEIFG